jgi:hypothetical protein
VHCVYLLYCISFPPNIKLCTNTITHEQSWLFVPISGQIKFATWFTTAGPLCSEFSFMLKSWEKKFFLSETHIQLLYIIVLKCAIQCSVCMYIGFKTFFCVVWHLDPIASYLPTGLHLGVFRFSKPLFRFFSMCFFCWVMRCWPIDPTPNLEDQCISLCLGALLWPVQQGWPYQ